MAQQLCKQLCVFNVGTYIYWFSNARLEYILKYSKLPKRGVLYSQTRVPRLRLFSLRLNEGSYEMINKHTAAIKKYEN